MTVLIKSDLYVTYVTMWKMGDLHVMDWKRCDPVANGSKKSDPNFVYSKGILVS